LLPDGTISAFGLRVSGAGRQAKLPGNRRVWQLRYISPQPFRIDAVIPASNNGHYCDLWQAFLQAKNFVQLATDK